MNISKRFYGWRPQPTDIHDLKYFAFFHPADYSRTFPNKIDLRDKCPPVYDQGMLGSCTANAIVAAYEYDLMQTEQPDISLSRLFLYYNERLIEGTTDYDAGAVIRDGIKSISKLGCCQETLWPYYIENFRHRPTNEAYIEAQNHQAIIYAGVENTIFGIQSALTDGYPVICGFTVYDSFESAEVARTGIMPYPEKEEKVVGGHAVLIVGYDVAEQHLIVRNSWSENWGLKGYFYMPFSYVNNHLVKDCWSIKSVE